MCCVLSRSFCRPISPWENNIQLKLASHDDIIGFVISGDSHIRAGFESRVEQHAEKELPEGIGSIRKNEKKNFIELEQRQGQRLGAACVAP
jgi:hypothetical protein